jgi:hypothetical protein
VTGADAELVLDISIPKLLREWDCDPFEQIVWSEIDRPVTREEVGAAIQQGRLDATPYHGSDASNKLRPTRTYHIQRIAFLVVHGWTDPVEMDLGCPSLGGYVSWPIQDGNHRFAAAIFQNHTQIRASLGGETRWIRRFQA